ncbi:hypothetical protein H5410_061903 [Solanum commersonii]|uniref:Uncharacterized protein n=1 Tax=Solanum commersonii TaxID=4109 RepID=A0A9J5W998_SOLCO|nr:hypothetical protein H5410_061903 [Solanum commersonii]
MKREWGAPSDLPSPTEWRVGTCGGYDEFDSDGIEEYNGLVAALDKHEYRSKPKKYELDMKNRESPPTRPSIEEAPKLELKALPRDLRYVYLKKILCRSSLRQIEFKARRVFGICIKRFKRAIGWTIEILLGSPVFALIKSNSCEHKPDIEHEED